VSHEQDGEKLARTFANPAPCDPAMANGPSSNAAAFKLAANGLCARKLIRQPYCRRIAKWRDIQESTPALSGTK